jgi:dTDP-glucose 4,6-dehydratase
MSKKTILLTGGFGFIFSNFIRSFIYNKYDYNLVIIDKLMYQYGYNNIYISGKYKYHIGDISNPEFVESIFKLEKPDIVINGAACSFVDDAIKDPTPFINSNVLGTQILLNACRKFGIEKFIAIGTDEEYGHLLDSSSEFTEESNLNPRNPYSASKAAASHLIMAANQTYDIPYNIIRPCNAMGPRQHVRNFIPKAINCILNDQKFPMYKPGSQSREWIFVEDLNQAIMTVLEKGKQNEVYNVSTGYELSNIEMFQKICNVLEKGHLLLEFVEDRPGHDKRYASSSKKLRDLGWAPKFKFNESLELAVNWFQQNKWWFK